MLYQQVAKNPAPKLANLPAPSTEGEEPLPTLAEMRRRVVLEVAWALVSQAVYSRRREEREGWGKAIARYWAGVG